MPPNSYSSPALPRASRKIKDPKQEIPMIPNPTRFIEEVKVAVSGRFCTHQDSKRTKIDPEIGDGSFNSRYKKVCLKCRKVLGIIGVNHRYD